MSKGSDTKEFILEKSARLFNLNGYASCSMKDIMDATGLQKGGIYNHFKNKEDIAVQSFEYSLKAIHNRFRERLDKDRTNAEKLFSVIEVLGDFYENPVIEGGCPVFNTAVVNSDVNPVLKEKAREGFEILIRYAEKKIEDGIESGEFQRIDNIRSLASLLLMTVEGGVVMSKTFGQKQYTEDAVSHCKEIIKEKLIIK